MATATATPTTTKRAPRARKPQAPKSDWRKVLATPTPQSALRAPDERVGPAGQMSLWWAPMSPIPEDYVPRANDELLTERAERVVACLDVLDEINAIKPSRRAGVRAPRVNHARARERWESTGAACIAAPEAPELTSRNRHLYRHVVRIYYRSIGDEILCFEVLHLTEMQATALASEYSPRSTYAACCGFDAISVQSWRDDGKTEPPAIRHGARLVILPSQSSAADPIRLALVRAGFDRDLAPEYAARLHAEDIGELELAGRLEIPPGEVGSLEYTHGFAPRTRTSTRATRGAVAPPAAIEAGEPAPAPVERGWVVDHASRRAVEVAPIPVVTPVATMTADDFFRLHTWEELRDRAARERDPYSAKPWKVLAYARIANGFSIVAGYNRYSGETISWIMSSLTADTRWDTSEAVEIVEVARGAT